MHKTHASQRGRWLATDHGRLCVFDRSCFGPFGRCLSWCAHNIVVIAETIALPEVTHAHTHVIYASEPN